MGQISEEALAALEARLGVEFRDRSLLERALTHRSYQPEGRDGAGLSNERLEFLGDAGLDAALSVHLYQAHPGWSQGNLTRARAAAVSAATLSRVARELSLGEFLRLGKGEERSGGRDRSSILADAVEAIVGAVFLETVVTNRYRYAAHETVRRIVAPLLRIIVRQEPDVGYDALLRELSEEVDKALPPWRPVREIAPNQDRMSAAEARIGTRFRNPSLLRQALTHASYHPAEADHPALSNGRLAFVGDAFLNSTVATHLYFMCPDRTEGELTRLRVIAVGEPALSRIGRQLGLGELLLLGKGEERSGGRERPSILAGAVKAIWAAICFDSPEVDPQRLAFRRFVLGILRACLKEIERDPQRLDPKTILQQLSQEKQEDQPTYHVTRESGPDHAKTFVVEARLGRRVAGVGQGHSKKEAEQEAARQALDREAYLLSERTDCA